MVEGIKRANTFSCTVNNSQTVSNRAKTIFNNIDKDNNDEISISEAREFGFSTLGDKPLSKEQFIQKYNQFCKKTSTIKNMLKPFNNIFTTGADKPFIHDVSLSKEQQKELLSRFEMFDAYFSTLNQTEKEELIKIKSDMMCFSWFRNDGPIPKDYELPDDKKGKDIKSIKNLPDYNNVQIKDFMNGDYKKLKEELKEGKENYKVSNAMLAKYLKFASVSELESDGKIGGFRQGSVGDCWFLAALMNYSSTFKGEKNIKDRIKKNDDGSFTVTFNNPFYQTRKEIFNVTPEELSNYRKFERNTKTKNKMYSSGDIDVRVLELAVNKMLEKYLPKEQIYDKLLPIEGSTYLTGALVHKAFGYTDNIEYFYIDNNKDSEDYGKVSNYTADVICTDLIPDYDNKAKLVNEKDLIYNTNSFIDIDFNETEITCGCEKGKEYDTAIHADDKKFMINQHEYSFYNINNNNITICNPGYISFPHTVKEELFDGSFFDSVTFRPQNNLITLDKCID